MSARNSILLVEGSRTQAERLRLVLQAHNYLVLVVTGGGDALEAARTQKPALIISGVALSGMDGYDMCAALKQDSEVKHIPVVLLTAVTDIEDLLRGLKAQVDYYIAKPYQEEELVARISAIMEGLVREGDQPGHEQLEVLVRGERKVLRPDRLQLLRLLLSTYENYSAALRQNRSLSTVQLQLKTQNQHLQAECNRLQTVLNKPPTPASPHPALSQVPVEAIAAENVQRVLVADHTAICRTLLARFLEKLGCRADAVTNGADAVAACQKQSYAAVLMDVQMPMQGGFEAASQIRRHERTSGSRVPILAMTVQSEPGDRERYLAAGVDDYLTKPGSRAFPMSLSHHKEPQPLRCEERVCDENGYRGGTAAYVHSDSATEEGK
jgi:CheY-like chemotaxis protein